MSMMTFVSIFLGLILQAILFQHGGITTIGVNSVMMGLPALLVYRIFDPTEGQIIEDILKQNSIPADVFFYEATPIYLLYTPSTERGVIRVKKEHAERAKKIISDFENNRDNQR